MNIEKVHGQKPYIVGLQFGVKDLYSDRYTNESPLFRTRINTLVNAKREAERQEVTTFGMKYSIDHGDGIEWFFAVYSKSTGQWNLRDIIDLQTMYPVVRNGYFYND